ncbi:hypothetical protein ACJJJB_00175 (plasmid) [Microbulbifer sp. ANSA001]|uniref:hypothetical protein n=1 Tax=Microbulbifer sp. ANSA001 TaxID=3243358 RepID=UPI00404135D0
MSREKRPCLGCGSAPRMRRNDAGLYRAECSNPACRWTSTNGGFLSKEGARVRWHRDNQAGCEETFYWWVQRHREMHGHAPLPIPANSSEFTQINNKLCRQARESIYAPAA